MEPGILAFRLSEALSPESENLQEDFNNICSQITISQAKLPVANKSKHAFYKDYYNKHTRDLIGKAFKTDIDTFDYDF